MMTDIAPEYTHAPLSLDSLPTHHIRTTMTTQNEHEAWRAVARLLRTVKYMTGIAERGTGRKQREDETAEQFVLGYVQSLEAAQQPSETVIWNEAIEAAAKEVEVFASEPLSELSHAANIRSLLRPAAQEAAREPQDKGGQS